MGDSLYGYRGGRVASRVDVDTCLRLLSKPLRRYLLRQLAARPSRIIHVHELVEAYDEDADQDVERDCVEIQLHHSHLPALADAGVIEYDEKSGAIRYYPTPKIEELLDVVSQWED